MDYAIEPTHKDAEYFNQQDADMDYKSLVEDIENDIISGIHKYTVEDCVSEIIYENKALLKRYKSGLQSMALGSTCGHELHKVLNEAVTIMAHRLAGKEVAK